MKTSIAVKCFPGFYESRLSEIYIEDEERWNLIQNYPDFKHIDDWELPESYRSEVAKEYAERYITELNDQLGLKMELTSESVESPREYNFTSDQVICYIEVEDWGEFTKKLFSLMDEPEIRVQLAKIIKEIHSDRPGFWSFMSNDIEEWYGLLLDEDNTNYLECVLWYLYCLKTGEDVSGRSDWGMSDQIIDYLSCHTDIFTLIPNSEAAKEEFEAWQENEDKLAVARRWPAIPELI